MADRIEPCFSVRIMPTIEMSGRDLIIAVRAQQRISRGRQFIRMDRILVIAVTVLKNGVLSCDPLPQLWAC